MAMLFSVSSGGYGIEFEFHVLPVLEKKCFRCHLPPHEEGGKLKKPKAGLILDSMKGIQAGSSDGPILVPGNADESLLYSLTALPDSDDDAMPPKGDDNQPLSRIELAYLKRWIDDGAGFGGWVGNEAGYDEAVAGMAATGEAEEAMETAMVPTDGDAMEPAEDAPDGEAMAGEVSDDSSGELTVAMNTTPTEPPTMEAPVVNAALTTPPAPSGRKTVNFVTQVLPMLRSRCFECHRAPYEEDGRLRKPKAGLRLDAARGIMEGSSDQFVVKVGNGAESLLYERCALPEGHDDIMPPEPPFLTESELASLKTWIDEGADFGGWVGDEDGFSGPMEDPDGGADVATAANELASQVQGVDAAAVAAVASLGASVNQIAEGNPLLRVEWVTGATHVTDEQIKQIESLAENVTELDLGDTQATDDGLSILSQFSKLTYLDLHNTGVTDATLEAIKELQYLEYLNLYGTGVTDASLPNIAKLKRLKAIYIWQTEISQEGAEKLQRALPDAKISM
ncbi:MAG: c-type cytochrome domain-containing protein [Verrucomicrobiota bacterium]